MTDIAKIVSKLQDLFWFGIPKNKRDYQRAIKPAEFISGDRVMYIRADPEKNPEEHYTAQEPVDFPLIVKPFEDGPYAQTVTIGAEYLRLVAESSTDWVRLTVQDDSVLKAEIPVGDRMVLVYIAPRIDNQ